MHVKALQDKLGHAKREIKALQAKLDRVKSIKLPDDGSEDYQQGVTDVALLVHRAMEGKR